ncbi:MAG TPA: T9SS type A sorting domain-containing protein, partial [Bacteroidetes bacterium]|nr:T9SS type A sorting domain-containing protein [Bacteroidota bacterium]
SIINNLNGTFEETTGPASEIREGMRSVPARGDINNDHLPDLMLGNYRGGLSFFKGDSINPDTGFPNDIEVLIYPNPAYDQITIEVLSTDEFEVTLFNGIGQSIYSEKHFSNNKAVINVSDWASGSYVVEVKYEQKRYVYHLIIVSK